MDTTYEQILDRMCSRYYELTGTDADRVSDVGIRLRVLAGEIFSLASNIGWLEKQMFPETATGEQLELHAAQRGLRRKEGSKAHGTIVFKLDMPLEYNVVVPRGTICTNADGSLNFIVKEDVEIERGSSYIIAPAQAERGGKQYNLPAGAITTIVTYFAVGIAITNSSNFREGTDDETDDELRERLAQSLKNIPLGANSAYYEAAALKIDGVFSARAQSGGNGRVNLYVAGRGGAIPSASRQELTALLNEIRPLGTVVSVLDPRSVSCNVSVSIQAEEDYTFEQAEASVQAAIEDYFSNLRVGDPVIVAGIGKAVFDAPGVANCSINSMNDNAGQTGVLYVLGETTIGVMT